MTKTSREEAERNIVCRTIERDGWCRGGDCKLNRGDIVIAMYSHRNRGQHIYFCLPCAELIGKRAEFVPPIH